MIYGNPNAKSESNGNAVFELFDVQGIVGFWHMDEPQWTGATGEVKDETGINHGTAGGGATTTSDAKYGRAGYFDGEDDYVDLSDTSSEWDFQTFSAEFWIKTTDVSKAILGEGGKWRPYISANGKIGFWVRGLTNEATNVDNLCSETIINDDTFYHIVVAYDIATMKMRIFVDGRLDAEKNTTVEIYADGHNNQAIGAGYTTDPDKINAIIDEVRIYNRALSSTEVQILSNNYMQKMGSYFNVRKYVTPAPVVIV